MRRGLLLVPPAAVLLLGAAAALLWPRTDVLALGLTADTKHAPGVRLTPSVPVVTLSGGEEESVEWTLINTTAKPFTLTAVFRADGTGSSVFGDCVCCSSPLRLAAGESRTLRSSHRMTAPGSARLTYALFASPAAPPGEPFQGESHDHH